MTTKRLVIIVSTGAFLTSAAAFGQGQGASQTYTPGVTFQSANPNYPTRNPFYFEGRVDWNLLKIDQPKDAWEFAQRGIHKQDDLEDIPGAIADYRKAQNERRRGWQRFHGKWAHDLRHGPQRQRAVPVAHAQNQRRCHTRILVHSAPPSRNGNRRTMPVHAMACLAGMLGGTSLTFSQ